jgi:protein TonB
VQIRRYLATLLIAFLVTFALFWVMQALIGVEGRLDESRDSKPIDFVRLKRETETETKKRELPDRKPPEKEPPPPELNLAQNLQPDAAGEGLGIVPTFDGAGDLTGPNLGGVGGADTDVVPLVRVNPEYPMRAAQSGIEGWVAVEFTISKTGAVKDPKVIAYEPSTVFNQAALNAIRRWKYNPKIEEGKAVERPGVAVRLVFSLDQSKK